MDVCRAAATLDHQWKVAFRKCVFRHGDPPLVVRVVDSPIPGRVHVAQPLHSLLASVEIPMNHSLAIVQIVLSPDHPVTLATENRPGTFLGGDVYYGHHHTFQIRCTCWDCNRRKRKEANNERGLQLKMGASIYILIGNLTKVREEMSSLLFLAKGGKCRATGQEVRAKASLTHGTRHTRHPGSFPDTCN